MKCASAVLLLTLCVVAAEAQTRSAYSTDVAGTLKKNNFTLAAALLDIANVTKPASNPEARATFLLPTDAAIKTFLRDMNLTVDELKKRPILAKQVVAQHTLLGAEVLGANIFENGTTRNASTIATDKFRGDDLTFNRSGGNVTVTGPQNVTAKVGKPIALDNNKNVLPIDKVLMGDDYYISFDARAVHRFWRVSVFCYAVEYAGLTPAFQPEEGLNATVFVPNNDAFSKAIRNGTPKRDALAAILKYHVVPGARELPTDWKANSTAKTLQGRNLNVTYVDADGPSSNASRGANSTPDWARIDVVTAAGEAVPVLKPNVHVGKAVVHGIGSVLAFNATSNSTLVKNGSNTTSATTPNLVPRNISAVNPNATSTGPATTRRAVPTTALEAAATTETGGNRKLLQNGGGGGGSGSGGYNPGAVQGPTITQNAASSAIRNAVAGNTRVSTAANFGERSASGLGISDQFSNQDQGGVPW